MKKGKPRKKGLDPKGPRRSVPISPELGKILGNWMKVRGSYSGPLFPAIPGSMEPWSPEDAQRSLDDLCRRAGVEPMTFEDIAQWGRENPEAARELFAEDGGGGV